MGVGVCLYVCLSPWGEEKLSFHVQALGSGCSGANPPWGSCLGEEQARGTRAHAPCSLEGTPEPCPKACRRGSVSPEPPGLLWDRSRSKTHRSTAMVSKANSRSLRPPGPYQRLLADDEQPTRPAALGQPHFLVEGAVSPRHQRNLVAEAFGREVRRRAEHGGRPVPQLQEGLGNVAFTPPGLEKSAGATRTHTRAWLCTCPYVHTRPHPRAPGQQEGRGGVCSEETPQKPSLNPCKQNAVGSSGVYSENHPQPHPARGGWPVPRRGLCLNTTWTSGF